MCGLSISDGDICPYHVKSLPDDWATGNRIFCDFIHRKIIPPTPTEPTPLDWIVAPDPEPEIPLPYVADWP